jgi:hypothetical protein
MLVDGRKLGASADLAENAKVDQPKRPPQLWALL